MKSISVGLLLPTSGIRPMSKKFSRAFESTAGPLLEAEGYELEVIPEMVGTGSTEQVDRALDKFFGYHDVDIATGIVSRCGIEMSLDKFKKKKVPFVFCNLGEHYIPSEGYSEYVLHNSLHLWQLAYQLGYYAGKNMGKGLSIGSMYDCGYSFLSAFEAGVMAADPEKIQEIRLLPLPAPGELANVQEFLSELDLKEYDYVFSLLCGEEATIFLREFKANYKQDIKLLGLPFLIEADSEDLNGLDVICPHDDTSGAPEDPLYEQIFTNMGKSAGRAIANAFITNKGKIKAESLEQALLNENPDKNYRSDQLPGWNKELAVYKYSIIEDNQLKTEMLWKGDTDFRSDDDLTEKRNAISSNWMNPYLAI